MAELEHVVRVTTKNGLRPPVTRDWTLEELVLQAYGWGRIDERAKQRAGEYAFDREPLTLAGVPLSNLRKNAPEFVTDLVAEFDG